MNDPQEDPNKGKRLGVRMISLDALRAHPLNSNLMPEDLKEKLRAHIHRTGRYVPPPRKPLVSLQR